MSQAKLNLPLPPGFALEQYRIERTLSHGGFSIVYLARDAQDQRVAIKEYLPNFVSLRGEDDLQPSVEDTQRSAFNHGLRCFFEESRALAGLDHPNVVHVLNFFRANGTAYLVMKFEHGRTLHEHVKKHGDNLSEEFLRVTFGRLLNGLREVHSHKLLHLDVKPTNIYLRNDGSPLLLDFGAARQVIGDDAPALRSVHTPGFSAPEQHSKRHALGPWTDIYGVGASLYACISGGRAPVSAAQRKDVDELTPATVAFADRYSQQLLETVDTCMRVDPLERPQSVLTVQKMLADSSHPRIPPKPGMMQRLKGFLRP